MTNLRAFLVPHRIVLMLIGVAIVAWCALTMRWDWLPKYLPLIGAGHLAHALDIGRDHDSWA